MPDPLSTMANAAAVVGLADVACRLGLSLLTFFRAVSKAPQDLRDLVVQLEQTHEILQEVREHAARFSNSSFATKDGLSIDRLRGPPAECQKELERLETLTRRIGPIGGTSWKRKGKDLVERIGWVAEAKEIKDSCRKLESLRQILATAISISGRQNDIVLREHIQITEDEQNAMRTAITDDLIKLQRSSTRVSKGISSLETLVEGQAQCFALGQEEILQQVVQGNFDSAQQKAQLQYLVQEGFSETATGISTIAHVQQSIETQTADNVQTLLALRGDIATAGQPTTAALHEIQLGQKRENRLRSRAERRQKTRAKRTERQLHHVKTMMEQLASFKISEMDDDSGRFVMEGVNLESLVLPLLLMKPLLYNAISRLLSDDKILLSKEEANFLIEEFQDLLGTCHEASAHTIRQAHKQTLGRRRPHGFPVTKSITASQTVSSPTKLLADRKQKIVSYADVGSLVVELGRSHSTNVSDLTNSFHARFLFIPSGSHYGISAAFEKAMGLGGSRIHRQIRVINQLPSDHLIYKALEMDDLSLLRGLLAKKDVSPWDWTNGGVPLLEHAAVHGSIDSTRLLLQEGADLSDTYCLDLSIWSGFIQTADMWNQEDQFPAERWISVSAFLHSQGLEFEDTHLYNEGGNVFHSLCAAQNLAVESLDVLCGHFLNVGLDIEARNLNSETPLLYAARSGFPESCQWLPTLLIHGADILAVDREGRTTLHKCFQRDVWMDNYLTPTTDCYCLDEDWFRQTVQAKLVALLEAGCSPMAADNFGRTPTHYARETWLLEPWQAALEEEGMMTSEIQELFEFDDVHASSPFWSFDNLTASKPKGSIFLKDDDPGVESFRPPFGFDNGESADTVDISGPQDSIKPSEPSPHAATYDAIAVGQHHLWI